MLGSIGSYLQGMRHDSPHAKANENENAFEIKDMKQGARHRHAHDGVDDVVDLSSRGRAFMANGRYAGPPPGMQVAASHMPVSTAHDHREMSATDHLHKLSLTPEQQAKIDALRQEIDDILGAPHTLTDDQKVEEKATIDQIAEILGKTSPEAPNEAEKRTLEIIHNQMSAIFADGDITADEAVKLDVLQERMDAILQKGEPRTLSVTDQEKLTGLYNNLDLLYGVKFPAPSEAELARVEEIRAELGAILEAARTGARPPVSTMPFPAVDPMAGLSAEDLETVQALYKEMGEIFGPPVEPKILSEAEHEREAVILGRIGELTAPRVPSAEDMKQAEEIHLNIAKLYEDGLLSPAEVEELTGLEASLAEIFGAGPRSETEQAELNGLQAELDTLHGTKTPSEAELARVAEIQELLNQIFVQAFSNDDAESDTA